jgi:hypothetical protein
MKELERFKFQNPQKPSRGQLPSGEARRPRTFDDVFQEYSSPKVVQVRIMLSVDATGSMSPHWNHLKTNLDEIINRLMTGGGPLLKIVAYRDDCDGDRIIEESAWLKDAARLKDFIAAIRCDGGGDSPEAVDSALQIALRNQDGVTSVVLIGDAPPHDNRPGLLEATELGKRHCPVYSIVVGGASETAKAFSEISRLSGGKMISLEKLDDLYDVLGVVIARGMGVTAFHDYLARYQSRLSASAAESAKLLGTGGRPRR